MRGRRGDIIWLALSLLFLLTLCASFLIMPFDGEKYTIAAGITFYTSLLMLFITQGVLAYRRREWCKKHRIRHSREHIGLISFFKNPYAVIADIFAVLSLIALVLSLVLTHGLGDICFAFTAVFVFSFGTHCIFNGKIFTYIAYREAVLRASEKGISEYSKKERKTKK